MSIKTFASNLRKECARGLERYGRPVRVSSSVMPWDDEVEEGSWGFTIETFERYGRHGPWNENDPIGATIQVTPSHGVIVSTAPGFPEELLECLVSQVEIRRK